MERIRVARRVSGVGVSTTGTMLAADVVACTPELAEPFDAFYRAYVDRIYRALSLTLGDPQLGREATDEAMTRAYARWSRVCALDDPASWVFRVGFNWAVSWWRRRRRELPALADDRYPVVAGPDPAGLAARSALERLPVDQRAVVVCRVLLDLSTADTAAVLGIGEGTAKSRLARALTALRAELGQDDAP